jgi:hypothetical protein
VFPIQKCGFLSKVKKITRLSGDVAGYVAQTNAPIDAEIGQKDHLWMETTSSYNPVNGKAEAIFIVMIKCKE